MEPRFVTDEAALMAGKTLVVADLHIGIEFEYYKAGIKIPSNVGKMEERLVKLTERSGAERLLILGDVKHRVPGVTRQELREIPEFLSEISKRIPTEIIPGNHDGNLKDLVPENVRIHSSKGFLEGKVYFTHGHAWPSPDFLKADYVLVGHEHPQIEVRDRIGYRFTEQVWVKANLSKKRIEKRYKTKTKRLPELIILPRFNPLSGGISFNRGLTDLEKAHKLFHTGLGPLVKCSDHPNSKIYLLDGTFLGKLKNLC